MPHTIQRTTKAPADGSKVPQVGCHCVPLTAWRTPVRYLYSAEVDSPRYALSYNDADGNVDLDDDANFDACLVGPDAGRARSHIRLHRGHDAQVASEEIAPLPLDEVLASNGGGGGNGNGSTNAKTTRRNTLVSWTTEAANLVADGDIQGAIDELEKVLRRVDGDPSPPDWLEDGAEKDELR